MSEVHDLINTERKKRRLPTFYWSREMARLAQSQANHCAKVGHLVHSSRYAFQGGENLAEGGRNFSPRAIVNCWLNSKAGHREYLLSPRVRKAGIGIAKSQRKTFVAWAFSSEVPTYPDCPYFKSSKPKPLNTHRPKITLQNIGGGMFKLPVKIVVASVSVISIVLGVHGLWVYFTIPEWAKGWLIPGGVDPSSVRLFNLISVPTRFDTLVIWITENGILSWFMPTVLIIVGMLLWGLKSRIYTRKVHIPHWIW